jgi:VanZ family protein
MKIYRITVVFFWAIMLSATVVSVIPIKTPEGYSVNDKLLHAAGIAFLCMATDITYRMHYARTASLMFSYGAMIEIIQYFIPYRSFSLYDMLANGVGIAIYWVLRLFFFFMMDKLRKDE